MNFNLSSQVIAFICTFILALVAGLILIPALRKLKFGQTVRNDGPSTHLKKTGTPMMGGFIFLIPFVIMTIILAPKYPQLIPAMLAVMGFAAVGFVDDFIKVVKKRKDGLYAKQKTIGLLAVALAYTLFITFNYENSTDIIIPFLGMDSFFTLPAYIYIPFTVFVLYSITNSVNLTDGVDGLCAGITLIVCVFFTIVAMSRNEWDYVKMFCSIGAGGCLGFLVFNMHPAKVFMGDTGSLGLGGVVGITSIVMKMPWILLIVGAIYVLESISVIIQVGSFKLRGKRVFKMAPIHHHFELSGWKETKIVNVFWIVTIVMCIIGFATLRFRFF